MADTNGAHPPTPSCFRRAVPPVDVQLLDLSRRTQKPIQPVGAYDIHNIIIRKIGRTVSELPPGGAAKVLLEEGWVETLFRAYLAVLSPDATLCPLRTKDALCAAPTRTNGRPAEILFTEICALVNYFLQGVRLLAPEYLTQWRHVYLWSALKLRDGTPTVQIDLPIDIAPSPVECLIDRLPRHLSAQWVLARDLDFLRDGYDAMLESLKEVAQAAGVITTPVGHPQDPRVAYATTADVHTPHDRLPIVFAERPNPWLDSDYHKQVLCILTFYKLATIRKRVLAECEEHHWPRDVNARGFNIFHPQPIGPELVYQQCGVRLHFGDREHSRKALLGCSTTELHVIFGVSDGRLREHLSDREIRAARQLIDFPYTLLAAYLEVYREWRASGKATKIEELFATMSSAACLNLRFYAITKQCQDVLGVKSIGQVVQDAVEAILQHKPEVDDLSLQDAQKIVWGHMTTHKMITGWDDLEKVERALEPTDVRLALVYLGFEP